MRTVALLALIATVSLACAAAVAPATPSPSVVASSAPTLIPSPVLTASPNASPSPTPASPELPTPAPSKPISPGPTPPPDLARVVVKEHDGFRVEVELQRNPMRAGEPSWVNVKVTNEGRTAATWFHDGCADPVYVRAVSQVAWPMGKKPSDPTEMFRTYALGGSIAAAPDPYGRLAFVPKEQLRPGEAACADLGVSDTIKPGESVRATHWWSGFTGLNRAIPPAGPATITAFAGYYWRGKKPSACARRNREWPLPGPSTTRVEAHRCHRLIRGRPRASACPSRSA